MPRSRASLASAWLRLLAAPGLGAVRAKRLADALGGAEAAAAADGATLKNAGLKDAAVRAIRAPDQRAIDAALAWQEQDAAAIICLDDPAYPPLLAAIPDPPPVLFVRGDVALLADPQIAVVGARNPTPGGREITVEMVRELAGAGLCVTSGLASGVDGAAHAAALSHGVTVAVLGTGPDRIYPAEHLKLAHQIAERGALVTEQLPGTPARSQNFPRRNRIISGLSLGTLVTEAAAESGSLITARCAADQGREVFAVPGSIRNPKARGCHRLIRSGATLVESAREILESLAPQLVAKLEDVSEPATGAENGRGGDLDPEYQLLLGALGHDPTTTDELIERTGLAAQNVSSMLLLLELQGYVSSHPGGRYCLR